MKNRKSDLVYIPPRVGKGSTIYGGPVLYVLGFQTYTNEDTLLYVEQIDW